MRRVPGDCLRLSGAFTALVIGTGNPVGSALARNLPKAPPPPRMSACDGMGPGFVKLEGSDTCVKMSGSVRVEFAHDGGSR